MAISTTITKKFFEMKLEDLKDSGYFFEYKERKTHWTKRFDSWFSPHEDVEIVFLVGNKPHRFTVIDIMVVNREHIPKKYQSAIHTDFAYAIKCEKFSHVVGCVSLDETVVIAGKEVLKDNDIFTVRT